MFCDTSQTRGIEVQVATEAPTPVSQAPGDLMRGSRSRQWRPYPFLGRSAQVLYKLQGEEVEGVRQEVREVNDEENGEINVEGEPHTS